MNSEKDINNLPMPQEKSEAEAQEATSFYDLPLHDDVLDALYDMRFDRCTPVQEKCIPPLLEGRDLIGIAQTGTGKTAAYLLPLLTLLRTREHPTDAVNCLIMAPTRELARQIDQAMQGFAYYMNINGVAVYGGNDGVRYEQERRGLTRGADVVIATPGRLITHLSLGTLDLSRTTHFVLDEADRMLDMGFSDDIMQIVKCLPKERQTILFSATMPEKINALARDIMHNPVEVRIAVSKPAEKIDQRVFVCKERDKFAILKHIFSLKKPERVIVFASSKVKVKEMHLNLLKAGYNVAAMHSDLEQKDRDEVMNKFKARQIDILVATDIVARGIDIDDITMVVNFDAPRDPEDYVHRIGRTARAGREGKAYTLVGEKDRPALSSIERLLEEKVPREPLPEGLEQPAAATSEQGRERRSGRGRGRGKSGAHSRNDKKRQGKKQHGKRDETPHSNQNTDAASNKASTKAEAAKSTSEGQTPKEKSRRRHRGGRHHRRGNGSKGESPAAE